MASGRNVINQSIRLEGGEEILRQLRSLGEEGERSARKLEQAFGRVKGYSQALGGGSDTILHAISTP